MTTSNVILIAALLALLSTLSFILLKVSSKEYPKMEKEPKFQPGNITFQHCTDTPVAEKPKRKYKKKRRKKPAVAVTDTTEKRSVGRPRKNQ
jgi:hypothetical protein